jgi:hypothetical protein
MKTKCEELAEKMLKAFYEAHEDPGYPGVRAHGLPGILIAVKAGFVSEKEWLEKEFLSSEKRWEVVAALRDLMDKGYINHIDGENNKQEYPDKWMFRLTPSGKSYMRELMNSSEKYKSLLYHNAESKIRVFVSSTWKDLQPERKAVKDAIHHMKDTIYAGMEYFGSRPQDPETASLDEVNQSDIYIGIFANRYGSGITEAEYRRARELDVPCLIYLKNNRKERNQRANNEKLQRLKSELKENHTVTFFRSPDHLATCVVTDLHNALGTAPSARNAGSSTMGTKYDINIKDSKGVVVGDNPTVIQRFNSSSAPKITECVEARLRRLLESISQDLIILEDYEKAINHEVDLGRIKEYRYEIEGLRKRASIYREDVDEINEDLSNKASKLKSEVDIKLMQMEEKLDGLIEG